MTIPGTLLPQLTLLLAVLVWGCGSSDGTLYSGGSGRANAGDASIGEVGQRGMDGSVRFSAAVDGGRRVDTARSDAGALSAELCDGIDNDGDGQIDNLDVGRDGICDCLRIATLGVPGGSGDGNIFADWLNTRSNVPVVALGFATLTPALLTPYQIIVAEDLHTMGRSYAPAELDALEAWVRAGGGLMTLIGYASVAERTNANLILARFGTSYGDKPILARTSASTIAVSTWIAHPVTQGVTRVGVDNGYAVLGSGTALAQQGGYDLLKVQELGSGHLIAWGDEWITYDSEWSQHPDYQVAQFWINAIKWLTVARVCQVPAVFL